ncbi:inorganic pyrophosphatase [Orientia tsutsugamushi str. Gilliam]|uniref:Inorganic pyrophosphatase n=5 Tax=Orientia tsutsugamushi TaxID=784 RepID=A0A0F3M9P8_ORITS|nr:inorganic diphosphatase [Orientia tsutsugamushi]KJW05797.1 inorganic pyrophosphatase [Orientia tsutsugamushi str. Sido]KJV52192.1 inorganic pyrophosphatase [Orientia tsutsugamushi str. Gilliam]KJV56327.1 inorganic pyrophosphatase [Orientia tsutsugamushi str. Kato PP]KJV57371.1 inorganic pyrophosphatase [Orientia tsutsugamushi str. Karp]KJV72820.1 inorganic pyrophosphatase [Orientia tsutsugamushi str. TA716]
MFIEKIKIGNDVPNDVNAIIEIPMNQQYIKYEIDKNSGAIMVDRFLQVAMSYPCNYGFIPHTLAGDNDPLDVLVISKYPLLSGSIINVRPVGGLTMIDESGQDEKILAVPHSKVDSSYDGIHDITDLDTDLKQCILHFFEHYKDLDKNKWVKVEDFFNQSTAKAIINQSIKTNLS